MIRRLFLFDRHAIAGSVATLLAGILAGSIVIPALKAQSTHVAGNPAPVGASVHYRPDHFAGRAGRYYALVWGVDALSVKATESGKLIRFSYQVLDPGKAGSLNDKKLEPKLISPAARAELVIPSLEKVGQLRQINTPEAGRLYWMAFSNPRLTVKRGDRVNVVIGQFHADGLLVE
jgi:hypothetical protein